MAVSTTKIPRSRDLSGDGKPHPGRKLSEKEFDEWVDDVTLAEWVDGEVIIRRPWLFGSRLASRRAALREMGIH